MAKSCRNRWFYILLLISNTYLLSLPPGGTKYVLMIRAANSGTIFLDNKEDEVQQIAAAARANHGQCELVSSCARDCSRATCSPLREDEAISKCKKVENNTYCNSTSDGKSCKEMKLNYSKSYLTLPKGADALKLQLEVRRDICLQHGLDATFRNISSEQSPYSYTYYGSTSGAWRAFPGRETSETFCTTFECRQRPWYLDGISVLKQVKILIDTGNTMGGPVTVEFNRERGATYLGVAIHISLSIIQTLSPEDFVEVISFNSTGAYSLGKAVNVGNYNQSDGVVLNPELEPLSNIVKSLTRSGDRNPSNLTAAIVAGIANFHNTGPRNYLKLAVVLSDGNFLQLSGTTFPTADIAALKAKLLIYRLPSNTDEDPYLVKTTLQTVLCGVQGSFEVLDAPATANPLFAIRSYFSYLAKVHMVAVASKALWSNVYPSITQVLDAVTVTYPAFDSDGELIGVAGIDVFFNQLEPSLQSEVIADFATSGRRRGSFPAPSNISLTCTYQNQSAVPVCSSPTVPADGILCTSSDTRTLQQRVCCGSCAMGGHTSGFPKWAIILIATVGALLLSVVVIGLIIMKKRRERRPDDTLIIPDYPGPPPEDT